MHLYRLARRKYAQSLDGQGAALYGQHPLRGRWNSVGHPLVYTAEHRSLAVLEYRVNNPLPMADLLIITLEVPDDNQQTLFPDELPDDWARYAYESLCAPLGDQWLSKQETLMLRVPSAVVAQEHNVLINPLHPEMKQVKVVDALPFMIDERMYGAEDA